MRKRYESMKKMRSIGDVVLQETVKLAKFGNE